MKHSEYSVLEICAGGGGQALGLEVAGFGHAAAVEIDRDACATLRLNRPAWKVIEADVREVSASDFRGVDLIAGGVPCPPFSIAGKQLGPDDERDLFPEALRLIESIRPAAVLLENVRGLASDRFESYRAGIIRRLGKAGYRVGWKLLNASDFGVPQLRPRFLLVAVRENFAANYDWPRPRGAVVTVGESLRDLMGANGWPGAEQWALKARAIAPTVVGGSKKHGGPDLGPTRARQRWAELGVDGLGIANEAPGPDHPVGKMPRLTVRMVARIQGFPDTWKFAGGKTTAYRQVGNAFPPPVARAIGRAIRAALEGKVRARKEPQLALFG